MLSKAQTLNGEWVDGYYLGNYIQLVTQEPIYHCPCGKESFTKEEFEDLPSNKNCHPLCKTYNHYNSFDEYTIVYNTKIEIKPETLLYSFDGENWYSEEEIQKAIHEAEASGNL